MLLKHLKLKFQRLLLNLKKNLSQNQNQNQSQNQNQNQPAKEPEKNQREPEPEPEPEPAPQTEEPKEQVNAEANQEQDAKPEEEEVKPVTEETPIEEEKEGLSIVNIMLYILGAIAVIAAGIYFFMRREPAPQSAADIARAQSQEPTKPHLNLQPEPEQNNRFKRKLQQKLLKKNLNQKIMINHLIMMMRNNR